MLKGKAIAHRAFGVRGQWLDLATLHALRVDANGDGRVVREVEGNALVFAVRRKVILGIEVPRKVRRVLLRARFEVHGSAHLHLRKDDELDLGVAIDVRAVRIHIVLRADFVRLHIHPRPVRQERVGLEHLHVLQSAVVSDALLPQHLNPLLRLDFSLHFHEGDRRAVFVDVDGGDFTDGAEGWSVLGGYREA